MSDLDTSLNDSLLNDGLVQESGQILVDVATNLIDTVAGKHQSEAARALTQNPKLIGFSLLCSVCKGKFPPSKMKKLDCGHSVCLNHNMPLCPECPGCQLQDNRGVAGLIDGNGPVWTFNDVMDSTAEFEDNHSYDELLNSAIEEFVFAEFRGCQRASIIASLKGHNVFVLMPSGRGKCLISTVVSMMLCGTSIIVSPLHSIIEDQLRHLNGFGIPAAHYDPGKPNNKDVYFGMVSSIPKHKLVYLTPEQFVSSPFKKII